MISTKPFDYNLSFPAFVGTGQKLETVDIAQELSTSFFDHPNSPWESEETSSGDLWLIRKVDGSVFMIELGGGFFCPPVNLYVDLLDSLEQNDQLVNIILSPSACFTDVYTKGDVCWAKNLTMCVDTNSTSIRFL